MIGEIVEHVRFGRGVVTDFDGRHIDVRFDAGDGTPRRFAYPGAAARFLSFEREETAKRARRDLESDSAASQREALAKIEESRRREEAIVALRLEEQHKKRVNSARKAAERRKAAMAARGAAKPTQESEA